MVQEMILVQQARRGKREALEALVEQYYPKIYQYIYYRVSNREMAQDLTQETFLKLVKSIRRYQPTASFSTFLYRIAHNTVIDSYRVSHPAENIDLVEDAVSESDMQDAEQRLDVASVLAKLPEEQQECMILYYYQQLTYREISVVLQIPVPTAKSRVQRGLAACRRWMEMDGGTFL